MAVEAKEPCPKCGGRGWIPVSELSVRDCSCIRRKILAAFLGPDLCKAPVLESGSSPLYVVNRARWDDPATLDRTSESLLIHARWRVIASHFQLALGHRRTHDTTFRFVVDTDQHLLNVYLGNEHAKWRQTVKGYNSLKDLVEDPELVIIRLGFIGHTNRAAANVLREAIMIRAFANKPTWIVKDPHEAFPVSWDEVVASYIDENFDTIDLTTSEQRDIMPEPVREEHKDMAVEDVQPVPRRPSPRPPPRQQEAQDVGLPGEGRERRSTYSKGKKKPSGSPV